MNGVIVDWRCLTTEALEEERELQQLLVGMLLCLLPSWMLHIDTAESMRESQYHLQGGHLPLCG